MVLNLLNNAFDATLEGSNPQPRIKLELVDAGECVNVRVTNTGRTIPQEVREFMFKPFFTTKPAGKGTGLGLSIVSHILSTHGGSVYLDTGAQETCFVAAFPKRQKR